MTDTPIPQQIADVYFDDIRAARTREPAFYDAVWEIANDLEAADEISEVEFDAALDAAMDLIRNATVTITYADGDAPHAIDKALAASAGFDATNWTPEALSDLTDKLENAVHVLRGMLDGIATK